MELICAVDLLDGGAVRLAQGDYARRVADGLDPVALARDWVARGARRIHVVDLEGARRAAPMQLDLVASVAAAVHDAAATARVELGGGLRGEGDVEAAFAAGVDDAILGSAAIRDPGLVARCAARWPGRVFASLDVQQARIALDGWTRASDAEPLPMARRLLDAGAARLLLTDTARDGTLGGPNLAWLAGLRAALPGRYLVAAGGVSGLDDLRDLASEGLDGAIVGLALLTGAVGVGDALALPGVAA